jgi:AraC-like DNA-binding protein
MLATSPCAIDQTVGSRWLPENNDATTELSWLPGDARMLVLAPGTRVGAQIRNRRYAEVPCLAVVGPTSQALTLHVTGAAPRVVALTALDWSRLTNIAAATIADRIVPANILGSDLICIEQIQTILRSRTGEQSANDTIVQQLTAFIGNERSIDVTTLSAMIGTAPSVLRRIALRSFGFPPKLLMMRRRFLTALALYRSAGADLRVITDVGYYDSSHFLRDANRFLGTTPRRYLQRIANI